MSADLQWMITRSNSCFLVKRSKQYFSREPNNLYNRHGKRASGLINQQAIGIEACTDDKGVVFVTKNKNNWRKPAKSTTKTILKQGNRRTLNTIRKVIRNNRSRKDQKMGGSSSCQRNPQQPAPPGGQEEPRQETINDWLKLLSDILL
ncbi:hypothetical protein NP493_442g00013 [Ridgeia piscesae]|uniref:Large ribosomal subunit protein eL28 n=1 Tax=Ridgeia piscesae TaxID=27915 RepID=A0AAD9L029_RIDPI|nr:hypothetical protein NP493_442g00013 [Ridgeia piscesae]